MLHFPQSLSGLSLWWRGGPGSVVFGFAAIGLAVVGGGNRAAAGPLDVIGYNRLVQELGAATPTGAGVRVVQSEALAPGDPAGGPDGNYPRTDRPEFAGKTFTPASGSRPASMHASTVGFAFYGTTTSPGPGITQITTYTAGDWLTMALKAGSSNLPAVVNARVANHSWVNNDQDNNVDYNTLQRMDYFVERDDFIQVAGVNNLPGGTNTPQPQFANAFNVIMVGNLNGQHSTGSATGTATPYTSGRTRPHLVGPSTVSSYSAPNVAGTAALLINLVRSDTNLSHELVMSSSGRLNQTLQSGETSEVIRAVLMAGASRQAVTTFPNGATYTRSTFEGLDARYGAGLLDVYSSYHILAAGETESRQAGNLSPIDVYGWDYKNAFVANQPQTYRFSIPQGHVREFAATLSWNLDINLQLVGGVQADPAPTLRNLNLRLRNLDTSQDVQAALGTGETTENLYLQSLGPGNYELAVEGAGFVVPFTTEYGLAWRFAPQLAGDVNQDGRVTLADLRVIQSNFGRADGVVWGDGDLNGDGTISRSDLVSFVSRIGLGLPVTSPPALDSPVGSPSAGDLAVVPEPSTVALALSALAGLLLARRRTK